MDSLDHDFKTVDNKYMPEQPRSSQEVKASLDRLNKFININEGHYFDKFLSNLYGLGASALQMSLYYKVCSFAVRNPDLVAAKMDNNSSNAATKKFIQSEDVVSYLNLAVTDITGVPFKGTALLGQYIPWIVATMMNRLHHPVKEGTPVFLKITKIVVWR